MPASSLVGEGLGAALGGTRRGSAGSGRRRLRRAPRERRRWWSSSSCIENAEGRREGDLDGDEVCQSFCRPLGQGSRRPWLACLAKPLVVNGIRSSWFSSERASERARERERERERER